MAGRASEDRVIIAAPTGRDAEDLCLLLVRGGLDATVCLDLQGAVSALDGGAGALLLTEEVLGRDACLLAEWIARQPAWSDLPVLLLRSDLAQLDSADVGSGFGVYGNVWLLERPLRSETLLSALEAALRARHRQYQIRAYLIEREQAAAALRELNATLEERVAQAVAEQRQTEAALVQAQKMEALGRLTGGVAHDFNNLLTAVLGNLELLQTRLPSDTTAQRLSDAAIRGIERGSRLTQQLLAFGRKQNLQLRAVNINEVIRGMGDLLTRTLGTTVRVDTELAEKLWSAHVDENQLVLVILNLAINARDAMPLGGTVRIKTANVHAVDGHPGDLAPGDFVRVSVIDDGIGMNEEVLGKVFEPFFTTKQQGKGTGLGLSQVYGLTKQSGGTVAIESAVGQGTSVHVFLRRAERSAAEGAADGADQRHAAPTAPSDNVVLVTDDDAEVRGVFVDYLARLGFRAIGAESGPDALARFYDGERIDLLLADFAMPGMNGAELVRRAREVRPELPVMMVTGYVDEAQLGAVDIEILRKPIRLADLGARVCELLGSPERTTSIPTGASFAGRRALAD
jgi:signal transduction histidine kinase/CheY-like chemotaxis protein